MPLMATYFLLADATRAIRCRFLPDAARRLHFTFSFLLPSFAFFFFIHCSFHCLYRLFFFDLSFAFPPALLLLVYDA